MKRSGVELRAEIAAMFAELNGSDEHDAELERAAARARSSRAAANADYWRFTAKLDPKKRAKKYAASSAWKARNAAAVAAYERSPDAQARKKAWVRANPGKRAASLAAYNGKAETKALRRIRHAGLSAEQREAIRASKRADYAAESSKAKARQKRWYEAHKEELRAKARERYAAQVNGARRLEGV